jgi:hypothetical protein
MSLPGRCERSPRLAANRPGALQQLSHDLRGPDLAGMGLGGVNERGEALIGGQERLGEQGVGTHRHRDEVAGPIDRVGGDARARSGTVVESQTFLGLWLNRREAQPPQGFVSVQGLSLVIDPECGVETEDRAGDITQRHQVAARADGPPLVGVRGGFRVQESDVALDDFEPDARCALQQGVRT